MTPAPAGREHGILLVDKAPDRTSHDVVARVRWLLGTKKVGHAGTLDPMATGLLVLGIGQGTRLLTHLVGLDKTYTATIRLGRATTTDDREGELLGTAADASRLPMHDIEAALDDLRGTIEQVPSTVSAVKIDGERAYARARAGKDVQLAARTITISHLGLTGSRVEGQHLDLDVTVACSSGTYVRALARDLGAALGVGGHLTALRRLRVGPLTVADAIHIPARGEGDEVDLPLLGLGSAARTVLTPLEVPDQVATDLGHGKHVRLPDDPAVAAAAGDRPEAAAGADAPRLAALDGSGRLVAVVEVDPDGRARTQLVVPPEART